MRLRPQIARGISKSQEYESVQGFRHRCGMSQVETVGHQLDAAQDYACLLGGPARVNSLFAARYTALSTQLTKHRNKVF